MESRLVDSMVRRSVFLKMRETGVLAELRSGVLLDVLAARNVFSGMKWLLNRTHLQEYVGIETAQQTNKSELVKRMITEQRQR